MRIKCKPIHQFGNLKNKCLIIMSEILPHKIYCGIYDGVATLNQCYLIRGHTFVKGLNAFCFNYLNRYQVFEISKNDFEMFFKNCQSCQDFKKIIDNLYFEL